MSRQPLTSFRHLKSPGIVSREANTLSSVRVALSAAILPDFLYHAVDKAYTISGIKALALKVKKRW
jgi:hypothetical protein